MTFRSRLILLLTWGSLVRSQAIILLGTGDPEAHTIAPTGDLAGSGWEFQIDARAGGTVIGPFHILTAAHLGFASNSVIAFEGLNYRVIGHTNAPGSDLRLLWVSGRFHRWAPTLEAPDEVGRPVVLFGRGGPRGPAVTVNGGEGGKVCGWLWQASDARLRWGTNRLEEIAIGTPDAPGTYLSAWFDEQGGTAEATVSPGDSGGGVFLQDDDGTWKLAGVLSSVEAAFRRSPEEATFHAAIFDRRNLWEELSPGSWELDPGRFVRPGAAWFATRMSAYHDWLETELERDSPVPWPRLLRAQSLHGPFVEEPAYSVEIATRRIVLRREPDGPEFFRIEGQESLRLVTVTDTLITLEY